MSLIIIKMIEDFFSKITTILRTEFQRLVI